MRALVVLAWAMLMASVLASDMAHDIGNGVSQAVGAATSIYNGVANAATSGFSQGVSQATSAYCQAVSQSCGQPTVSASNPSQSYSGAIGKIYTYGESVSGASSVLNQADSKHPAGTTVGVGNAPADGSHARSEVMTTSTFVGLACVVGAIGALAVFL